MSGVGCRASKKYRDMPAFDKLAKSRRAEKHPERKAMIALCRGIESLTHGKLRSCPGPHGECRSKAPTHKGLENYRDERNENGGTKKNTGDTTRIVILARIEILVGSGTRPAGKCEKAHMTVRI